MDKHVYVFNGHGALDLLSCLDLYNGTKKTLPELICNKYCCVFNRKGQKTWSRSGSTKNMESNFSRYLGEIGDTSRLVRVEIYDRAQGPDSWELFEKQGAGFFVDMSETSFNIYVVLFNVLSEEQIVKLWTLFSDVIEMNYMVSFSLDVRKHPEIYMYGVRISPANIMSDKFYNETELEIVDKLYALRMHKTYDLEDVFPVCIVTGKNTVRELGYISKKTIDSRASLFSK